AVCGSLPPPPPVHLRDDQCVVFPLWTGPTHLSMYVSLGGFVCFFFFVFFCRRVVLFFFLTGARHAFFDSAASVGIGHHRKKNKQNKRDK
ncbi:MAG: hypothetical protein AAGK05_19760, partial [Pseudomonadota bacterium]